MPSCRRSSNFSFLAGGSHPHELVAQAKALGLAALGIADRNTLAGVVRAHVAAKEAGLRLIVGARLDLEDAPSLLCYPTDRAAYGRLCRLLSLGQGRAEKGQCHLCSRRRRRPRRRPGADRACRPTIAGPWREGPRACATEGQHTILSLRERGFRPTPQSGDTPDPPFLPQKGGGLGDTSPDGVRG